jgi:hypothetical protein
MHLDGKMTLLNTVILATKDHGSTGEMHMRVYSGQSKIV